MPQRSKISRTATCSASAATRRSRFVPGYSGIELLAPCESVSAAGCAELSAREHWGQGGGHRRRTSKRSLAHRRQGRLVAVRKKACHYPFDEPSRFPKSRRTS